MTDTNHYEEFDDRTEITPTPRVQQRSKPQLTEPEDKKEDYFGPDDQYAIKITIIEYHKDEVEARHRLRHFDGAGLNKVTLVRGNKILEEKEWSYITGKHGSGLVDGRQHKVHVIAEE